MTALEPLPHAWPFRFVDRTVERTGPASGTVRVAVSAGQRASLGGAVPSFYLPELVAQAALLLQGGDALAGRGGFLAGLSDVEFLGEARPGDLLTVTVRLAARLGPAVRFEGEISADDGRPVARAALTVRQGTPPAEAA